MKKLIIALLLLPMFAGAQTYQAMPQAGYGPVKRMLFDSVLTLPLNITKLQNATGGRDIGQIRYNVSDSSIYIYSGSRWIKSGIDTSTIYYNLGLKLNISDTAQMMAAAPRVQRFLDSITNLKSSLALKLNIADTASMLTPYTRATATALKLNISDTAGMLSAYTRLAANSLKLNISDTAAMMAAAPRVQRFLDSVTNLKSSLALKLNIADTATMLTPYLRKADTTGKFITNVFRKAASDSVFFVKGGTNNFAYKDSTGGGNIYTQDGTLTGARTVTLGTNLLKFTGSGASGLSIENNSANAAPTMLSFLNNGTGGGTGAKIVFPWSSSITSTFNGGYVFNAQGVDILTAFGNGVTIPTNALTFSGSTPALITHSSTATGTFTIKTGGNILLQNYTGSYDTRLKIAQTTGNVIIQDGGTFTDRGYRLQITGTAEATQFKISALNTAPASATATGVLGEIRITSGFIYVCTATNTWVRSALTTW